MEHCLTVGMTGTTSGFFKDPSEDALCKNWKTQTYQVNNWDNHNFLVFFWDNFWAASSNFTAHKDFSILRDLFQMIDVIFGLWGWMPKDLKIVRLFFIKQVQLFHNRSFQTPWKRSLCLEVWTVFVFNCRDSPRFSDFCCFSRSSCRQFCGSGERRHRQTTLPLRSQWHHMQHVSY